MPISDRDYMKAKPPSSGQRRFRTPNRVSINPLIVLIGINILTFIVTSINQDARFELAFIPVLIGDRPWTIFTSILVHADIWHLLFNTLGLFFLGRLLRKFIGDNTFLILYFASGLAGNLFFWAMHLNDVVAAIGASGAVYGLAGALAVIVPKLRIALWGIIPMPLWVFVLVFLVILSLPGLAPATTAWQAHFGGLIVGVIAGFIFRRRLRFLMY